jgi:hexosaminidase
MQHPNRLDSCRLPEAETRARADNAVRRALLVCAVAALSCAPAGPPGDVTSGDDLPAIVPAPSSMRARDGRFVIDASTRFALADPSSRELRRLAEFLAVPLREATGHSIPIDPAAPAANDSGVIALVVPPGAMGAADSPYDWSDRVTERYTLEVTPERVTIEAASPAGLFRGLQTLRQLLPPDFEDAYAATHGREWRSDESRVAGAVGAGAPPVAPEPAPGPEPIRPWSIPAVSIDDEPRFAWRGMHLDVARHFFEPEFVRKYIDLIAAQRMNVFHWHLTEDQGWRIQIAKYPRLTEVGAFRDETMLARNFDPYVGDGIRYGGFYTQDEIREIVDHAASRYVTIVPEIEMPGHSVAALAAYPELGCTDGPFEVATVWGVMPDIYCPHDRTFEFLEDVLTEVMQLFPGRFIHVGGDEAPKTAWEQSDVAQDIIRRENLEDEHGLQSWFIRRIERFLNDNGRQLVGWDEILEGGLAPDATVMSWRGMQGGIDAAREGHDVVMTPNSHVYFDYYQGQPESEPLAIGGFLPLERVYSFEPVPDELSETEARHVLGTQGNIWTEYMKTADHVEYMAVPRMLALAEVAWSPAAARNWNDFLRRLPAALDRLNRLDVDYRMPDVYGLDSDRITLGDTVVVTLSAPLPGAVIRYTLDGEDPTISSPRYEAPLEVQVDEDGVTVSARAFAADGRQTAVARAHFAKATLRAPELHERGNLTDGLRYSYHEGAFRSADDVRAMQPMREGTATAVGLQGIERDERFALRFTGYVNAQSDGIYTFSLQSDDGSRLRIGDALVIDHDGPHGPTAKTGQVALAAGWHVLEVTYYQAGGGRSLSLAMSGPGMPSPAPVPSSLLAHATDGTGQHP